jgi:Flp pilus assembly protein TadG
MNAQPWVSHHDRRRRSRGQSLVEFSLVLPIFLIVLAGVIDFGFMFFSRMTVINAAREGARWAVTQTDVTKIPTNSAGNGLQQSGGAIGTNLLGLSWSNMTVQLSCVAAGGGSCDFVAGGAADAQAGDSIIVKTTYTYRSFFSQFFGQTTDLGTQVRMVLEVPAS